MKTPDPGMEPDDLARANAAHDRSNGLGPMGSRDNSQTLRFTDHTIYAPACPGHEPTPEQIWAHHRPDR